MHLVFALPRTELKIGVDPLEVVVPDDHLCIRPRACRQRVIAHGECRMDFTPRGLEVEREQVHWEPPALQESRAALPDNAEALHDGPRND